MRWLADECVHRDVVLELRKGGHDVTYVAETAAQSADRSVLAWAKTETRILLTEDKDFGDLVFRDAAQSAGVVLLRIQPRLRHLKWPRLAEAIVQHGEELHRRFTVIEEARIRP